MRIGLINYGLDTAARSGSGIGRYSLELIRALAALGDGPEVVLLSAGKSDGLTVDMEQIEWAKDTYYAMAGWDVASGTPTRAKLEELSLGWLADQLEA